MIVVSCPACYRMVREDHLDAHVHACPVRSCGPWVLYVGFAATIVTVVACWLGA